MDIDKKSLTHLQFDALMQRHEPQLRHLLRTQMRQSSCNFDEMLQETRLKLWQVFQREKNLELPSSYLRKVVISVIVDALRQSQARKEEPIAVLDAVSTPQLTLSPELAPDMLTENAQRQLRLQRALAELPDRRKAPTALLLRGFNCQEIAQLLKLSEATARNLAYRGIEDLKQRISPELSSAATPSYQRAEQDDE